MRKVINILSIVTLLSAAVSCAKTDLIYDDTKTEIAMKPVMHTPTKAIVEGTTYPAGVNFRVLAYYSSAYGDQDKWTDLTGENAPVPYIDNQEFVPQGDGTFGGSDPCYWPHQGSLVFAGYSPFDAIKESVTFDPVEKILTIAGFESDGQTDLMYFLPDLSNENLVGINSGGSSIPAAFSHALTLLEFNIKGIEGDKPIKLKKISIASGKWYSTGDFTVTAGGNPEWKPEWKNVATSGSELVIYSSESGHLITTTPFSVSGLVIPGETVDMAANAVDITIDYEVNAAQTPQKSGTVEASLQPTWVIGKKYIYDITIASGFIVVNPSVGNYAKVDGPDPEI